MDDISISLRFFAMNLIQAEQKFKVKDACSSKILREFADGEEFASFCEHAGDEENKFLRRKVELCYVQEDWLIVEIWTE